jgi:tRNA pseudouridine55 synthase
MINAILVLDKPAAFTSHDIVNRVRRITSERSVGHLGTLDPMATGILPLVLGRYTRLAQFFNDSLKVYEGEIRFGFSTDTYDAEGEAVGPSSAAQPTLAEIHRHLPSLTGCILQTPPIYSAKKIHGVAAYKLARKDKPVEMKPVEVEVHRFEILSIMGDRARFIAEVSAGTYIRSLAHDLGQALGCGAHLSQLRRTQAGEFNLSQAVTLEELEKHYAEQASDPVPTADASIWVHPRTILSHMPSVTAAADVITYLRNGRAVNLPEFSDAPLVKVFANQSELFAIAQRVAGTLFRPKVVIG